MKVKDQVFELLQSKAWLSVEDFEKCFPPKSEGHMSWPQRLRELRQNGFKIIKRKKAGCPHTFEYHLCDVEPKPTEHESALIHNHKIQEDAINTKEVYLERGKQLCFIG